MSDNAFGITSEDIRKAESKEAAYNDGKTPKDSDVSAMKVMQTFCDREAQKMLTNHQQLLSEQESKQEQIDRVQANLPLPDDPMGPDGPVSGDLESADARTVNVGSGGVNVKLGTGGSALREPATAESSARVDGDVYQTNTEP